MQRGSIWREMTYLYKIFILSFIFFYWKLITQRMIQMYIHYTLVFGLQIKPVFIIKIYYPIKKSMTQIEKRFLVYNVYLSICFFFSKKTINMYLKLEICVACREFKVFKYEVIVFFEKKQMIINICTSEILKTRL